MLEGLTRVYGNVAPPTPDVLRLRGASPEVEQVGQLGVTPVTVDRSSAFGAEVSGVEWTQPIPDTIVQQVGIRETLTQVTAMLTITASSLRCKTSMLS